MRAVVRLKLSQGSSPSNAARYIAESRIDPEREGGRKRPLFTNRVNEDLTYRDANSFLTQGQGTPTKNDLIHFSVSFRMEDFEALGVTDDERKERLREAGREAMEDFKEDLRANHYKLRSKESLQLNWRWVAGIHLNTDNPHIHFLVHKDVAEWKKNALRVGRVPKRLLPRMERSLDGGLRPVEGVIGGRFAAALERAQELARGDLLKRVVTHMGLELFSSQLEFEVPLDHQGVAYNNVETFRLANMLSNDGIEIRRMIASLEPDAAKQLETHLVQMLRLQLDRRLPAEERQFQLESARSQIATFFPAEASEMAEQLNVRLDWPKIRLEVEGVALEHLFAPGTRRYVQLRFTGDRELSDGSKDNPLGKLLMDLREESRRGRPDNFLERLDTETRAWVKWELMPGIDRLVEAGKPREEILAFVKERIHSRALPSWENERRKEMAERDRINDFLGIQLDHRFSSDDRLQELAERNRSRAGRELIEEMILRGSERETDILKSPENLRQAFENRSIDHTDYRTQAEQADYLGEISPNLRNLYETGATVINSVLVLPIEEHQAPDERESTPIITISYAHRKIPNNPKLADEFHRLGRAIAGESGDIGTEIKVFEHYYDRIARDDAGRPFDNRDKNFKQKLAAALERTLPEMRILAGEMAMQESRYCVELAHTVADLPYSYKQIQNREEAEFFHGLVEELVGPNADLPTRVNVFNNYYRKLERDESGNVLAPGDDAGRTAALVRTIGDVRMAVDKREAPEVAPNDPEYITLLDHSDVDHKLIPEAKSKDAGYVPVVQTFTSFEEMGGAQEGETGQYLEHEVGEFDDVDEREADDLGSPEFGYALDGAYSERAADAMAWRYNATSHKVYLGGDSLRFPEGWDYETKERAVCRELPVIDRRIEKGAPLYNLYDEKGKLTKAGILSDINRPLYPDRDEVLSRTANLAGWSGDQARPGRLKLDELNEVRDVIFDLSLSERSKLESRRDFLLEGKQDLAERKASEASMANTFLGERLSKIENLVETLPNTVGINYDFEHAGRSRPEAGWGGGENSQLYVSLSGEKDSPRLPVSNIRVWDAIRELTEGAGLDLQTWKGKDGPPIVRGFIDAEYSERVVTARFLNNYVHERLRDQQTRFLHDKEAFRAAHTSLVMARTLEELNRAADVIRESDRLGEKERKLLFFGPAPDHYTPEMREMLHTWWLPLSERVKCVEAGVKFQKGLANVGAQKQKDSQVRLAPSTALIDLIAELGKRNTEGRVDYFYKALTTYPGDMTKPEESVRLGLWEKSQGLLSHERAYLFNLTWEAKEFFAGREPSLRETAPQLVQSKLYLRRVPRDNEALRLYLAAVKDVEQSLYKDRNQLPQAALDEIRDRALRMAWDRLVLPEIFEDNPTPAARLLNDTITELRERAQPRARVAAQALNDFIRDKTGTDYSSDRIPQEALGKLDPADLQRLEELKHYANEARGELFKGFEVMNKSRQEIIEAREAKGVEKISSVAAGAGDRSMAVNPSILTMDSAQVGVPARTASEPHIDSQREYMGYVDEVYSNLLSEALRQKSSAGGDANEITQSDRLLTGEDRLELRALARRVGWERLESQPLHTHHSEPINPPSLSDSLSQTVARLRDEVQPRAWEAALSVDRFIRDHDLDKFVESKNVYYYLGDQVPKTELEKLSLDDQKLFADLNRYASATLGELKDGFKVIDKIRLGIDRAPNGVNGNGEKAQAQSVSRLEAVPPNGSHQNREANPERERMNDRQLLGAAMIAHALADCAVLDYETARNYGNTFRFNIYDESLGGRRKISEVDVRNRASTRGARAADEVGAGSQDDRLVAHGRVSEADINHHTRTLAEHGKKLGQLIADLESRMNRALNVYQSAGRLAGEVIEKYRRLGEPLPAPFVERETLVKAQDETIKHGLPAHTENLERIRVEQAKENGQPVRSDQETVRLAAQVFTADTELKAREERARRFDETRHIRQWDIGGERFSLAYIDQRVERLNDAAAVFGRYEFHLDPLARKASRAEIDRLTEIRQEVVEKIGRQRDEMHEKSREAGKLFETLAGAYDREAALHQRSGNTMHPRFTREELERAGNNIETARYAEGLAKLSVFERQFNEYADLKDRFSSTTAEGLAPARAVMADIFHRESVERLNAFGLRGEKQRLLIETSDGRLITHSLKDTEPQSVAEIVARPLIETSAQRELREGTRVAFAQYEARLKADFEQTRTYLETARKIANDQNAERSVGSARELPTAEPVFNPRQTNVIERYAERQADPTVRDHFLSLARGSCRTDFDSQSRGHSSEPHGERERAPDIGRAR